MDHQFSGGVDKQPSKTSRTTRGGGGGGGGGEGGGGGGGEGGGREGGGEEGLVVGGLSAKEKQQLVAQYGVESDGEDDLYPSHTFSVQTILPYRAHHCGTWHDNVCTTLSVHTSEYTPTQFKNTASLSPSTRTDCSILVCSNSKGEIYP